MSNQETFGQRVRRRRMEKQITLREFAKRIHVSPTYVSQIERDEYKPPSEATIREIAHQLDENEDELLGLAQKISSDLSPIITRHPQQVAAFLRTAQGFKAEDWEDLTKQIQQRPTRTDDDD